MALGMEMGLGPGHIVLDGVLKPETVSWTGYPGPEPDGYPVLKIPESLSTSAVSAPRRRLRAAANE